MTRNELAAVNEVRLKHWALNLRLCSQLALIVVTRSVDKEDTSLNVALSSGITPAIASKMLRQLADDLGGEVVSCVLTDHD